MIVLLSFLIGCAAYKNLNRLTSYDDKVVVRTVFGTGRPATTDSIGLLGEINTPTDIEFDTTETYLYMTDLNGGGLLRKLAAASNYGSPFTSLFSVKTVFTGLYLLNYYHQLIRFKCRS